MKQSNSKGLVVGTRGSLLAVTQTNWVIDRIQEQHPGLDVQVERISTRGDRNPDAPLPEVGQKGIFTQELEDALLEGRIDLAVHSAKDLPQELPGGLDIVCVPPREDPRDALVSRTGAKLSDLPEGAVLGTSSLRRQAQLRLLRPDFEFCILRGNVDTRINKVHRGDCDGTLLALAGMRRVGLTEHVTEVLDIERLMPAPSQGILAVEGRAGDQRVRDLLAPIACADSVLALDSERKLVDRLEGGCRTPIGALLEVDGDNVTLAAVVASPAADRCVRAAGAGSRDRVDEVIEQVFDELAAGGAAEIIEACRDE